MSKKTLVERVIDRRRAISGIAGTIGAAVVPGVVSTVPSPAAPTGLAVSANTLLRSAVTPTAIVTLSWNPPGGWGVDGYLVEVALDSGFATGVLRWSAGENGAALELATNTTYYARVYAIVRGLTGTASDSISFLTVDDTTAAAQPTGLAGDFTGPDLIVTWTNPTSGNFRDVEVRIWNSSGKTTLYHTGYSATGRYVWTFAQNTLETSGAPDPAVYVELRSRTWAGVLNSASPPSVSPTNAAPSAPSATLTSGYNRVIVAIGGTRAADWDGYEVAWKLGGVTQRTDIVYGDAADFDVSSAGDGSYTVTVRQRDVFGQFSSGTTSSAVVMDVLTLAELREGIRYSDSDSTAAATLKAALANETLTSGGITYASNASWVRWIRTERDLLDRIRTLTLSITPTSSTTRWYVRLSSDGTTWSYYSGPLVGTRTVTSVASEAAAQSAALATTSLGGQTTSRVDLPATVEARFVEVWLRNTDDSSRVDEFYPRRLVQADDIQVQNLSAISADIGSVTAGTLTGATVQTAASGARIELTSANGLRSYNSGGTLQTQLRTSDGALVAGGGGVVVDASGLTLDVGAAHNIDENMVKWDDGGNLVSTIDGYKSGSVQFLRLEAGLDTTQTNHDGEIYLDAYGDGTGEGRIYLRVFAPTTLAGSIVIEGDGVAICQGTPITPAATLDVERGTLTQGTARFQGTTNSSHFNYSTGESTYIRGGKSTSDVYIGDVNAATRLGGDELYREAAGSFVSAGIFVPITPAYLVNNGSLNNTTATYTVNSVVSAVPTNAKALAIDIVGLSTAAATQAALYRQGGSVYEVSAYVQVNNMRGRASGICGINTSNGQVTLATTGNFSAIYVTVTGYFV